MGNKDRSIKRIIKKKIHIINNQEQIINNKPIEPEKKKVLVQKRIEPTKTISTPTINISKTNILKTIDKKGHFEARTGQQDTRPSSPVTPEIFKTPYIKRKIIDYDVIVVLSSFDRYLKAKRILTQLFNQQSKYTYKIIIYNDGSTDQNYSGLPMIFPEIEYIEGKKNNGKYDYWKSLTTLFQSSRKYKTHAVCQIDDDYLLCDKFIDSVMDEFFHIKTVENRYVSVYYHKTGKENQNLVDIQRIDGGVLFDVDFLNHIGFEVKEPSKTLRTEISSGVWRYLSMTIKANACLSYRLDHSLVKHDGNEDSKMHKGHRDKSPINSFNFKDELKK